MNFKIGQGFDVHKLVHGRELWIGGIKIDYHLGLLGHSDADVALHALCDALLGAAALRDIGYLFPDNDNKFKDIDSKLLLKETLRQIVKKGYKVGNVDITIIAQAPKLSPYIESMRKVIADILCVDIDSVSVKATTTEHLGFTGRGEGIAALSNVLIFKEEE